MTVLSTKQCFGNALPKTTGCLKINETHKIADKYVDFNPIFLYFSNLIAVINNNYYFKTPWPGN